MAQVLYTGKTAETLAVLLALLYLCLRCCMQVRPLPRHPGEGDEPLIFLISVPGELGKAPIIILSLPHLCLGCCIQMSLIIFLIPVAGEALTFLISFPSTVS